jgi:hypothetical protein
MAANVRSEHDSKLALGTVQWGMGYGIVNRRGRPDEAEVGRIFVLAPEAGVTTQDTARAYVESEQFIGSLGGRDPARRGAQGCYKDNARSSHSRIRTGQSPRQPEGPAPALPGRGTIAPGIAA